MLKVLALGNRQIESGQVEPASEVFSKPYRIIYRAIDETVYVLLIADGRRDMQSLLQRRLVEG